MRRDLMNNVHPVRGLSPVSVSDNTAQVSEIIDTEGFQSLTWLIATGAIADADVAFTVLAEHGDQADLSDAAPVPDDELIGTEALAGFLFSDANKTRKLGVKSVKRYQRLTITPANNTGAALLAAIALLGHPDNAATDNPPV